MCDEALNVPEHPASDRRDMEMAGKVLRFLRPYMLGSLRVNLIKSKRYRKTDADVKAIYAMVTETNVSAQPQRLNILACSRKG